MVDKKEQNKLFSEMMEIVRNILAKEGFDMLKFIELTNAEREMISNPDEVWPRDLTDRLMPITQQIGECRDMASDTCVELNNLFEQLISDKDEYRQISHKIESGKITTYEVFRDSIPYANILIVSPSGTTYEFNSVNKLDEKLSNAIKQIAKNETQMEERFLTDDMSFMFKNGYTGINFKTFLIVLYLLDYNFIFNIK